MSKNPNRYVFSLIGVNINKVDQKYIFLPPPSTTLEEDVNIPMNTTKIDDLDIIKKTPDVISFLDESKRLRKCAVSMIDFRKNTELTPKIRYKCFWDKNIIPDGVQPIGCPIKYIANRATKTYHSEISKEKYTITETVTPKRSKDIETRHDKRLSIDRKDYYETDGAFCSFNCCMAFINEPENKRNPIYRHSEALLLQMYNEINTDDMTTEIFPAPHWRTLVDFGGHQTIEQFRESFNKILFVEHGIVCVSIGKLYEDQIKF